MTLNQVAGHYVIPKLPFFLTSGAGEILHFWKYFLKNQSYSVVKSIWFWVIDEGAKLLGTGRYKAWTSNLPIIAVYG